jgi:hypothetical protein
MGRSNKILNGIKDGHPLARPHRLFLSISVWINYLLDLNYSCSACVIFVASIN